MEFDSHLALVQGCLTHVKRIVGPLDQLNIEKNYDAVCMVLDKLQVTISGFQKQELCQAHLFLLLNSQPAVDDDSLQESDYNHLIGIAPVISIDVLLALSVEEVSFQKFFYDAILYLPFSVSYKLASSFVSQYVKRDFKKVAGKLDLFCVALGYNVLACKDFNLCKDFLGLIEAVLVRIHDEEEKVEFPLYVCLLKAVISLLKLSLIMEVRSAVQKWKDINVESVVLGDTEEKNVEMIKKLSIEYASKMCLKIPSRLEGETSEDNLSLFQSVRELAYECLSELKTLTPSSYPGCDSLLNVFMEIAQKQRGVVDEINDASLESLCSNSLIENENQSLWLKALIRHSDGLENETALKILLNLVNLFDTDDCEFVCDMFNCCENIRSDDLGDLVIKCFTRLSMEKKLSMLNHKVHWCDSEDVFANNNFESELLEVLNRLVSQEGTDNQDEQLLISAYKCPKLVVKHIFLTAKSNYLFSTSVAERVVKLLWPVFAALPNRLKATNQFINLTDVTLSNVIFDSEEINKECGGLQNLIKILFKANLLNRTYFLNHCIFHPLFVSVKECRGETAVLLLEILLDVLSEARPEQLESLVDIPILVVFLGQCLEYLYRISNTEHCEGNFVREVFVRSIRKVLSIPNVEQYIEGSDRDWVLNELSTLSPVNRHYFAALEPEWMLFNEESENVVFTLATVLPHLHVSEWEHFLQIIPPNTGNGFSDTFEKVLAFCSAVNLIVQTALARKSIELNLNLTNCVWNLGSVLDACLKSGIEPLQAPIILRELLVTLELFPEPEQFDLAMFLLPIMVNIIDQGCHDGGFVTAVGKMLLNTSVQCVRKDLGRHLKRAALNLISAQ